MTIFYAKPYLVGGSYTHGGDEEVHFDEMPADLTKVWEIDPFPPDDTRPWTRDDNGLWSFEGEDGLELSWEELLYEFGPLTDDEGQAGMGLDELKAQNDRAAYAADLAAQGYEVRS